MGVCTWGKVENDTGHFKVACWICSVSLALGSAVLRLVIVGWLEWNVGSSRARGIPDDLWLTP